MDYNLWDIKRVLTHKLSKRKTKLLYELNDVNQEQQCMNLNALAFQDIIPIVRYIQNKKLEDQPEFKKILLYCKGESPSILTKNFNAKTFKKAKKYMFGVEV